MQHAAAAPATGAVRPIRVYVRMRPPTGDRPGPSAASLLRWDEEAATISVPSSTSGFDTTHTFDAVVGSNSPASSSQTAFYAAFVEGPLRQSVRSNQHLTVMAYGQTGSGKTHTIAGSGARFRRGDGDDAVCDAAEGVAQRAIRDVFTDIGLLSGDAGEDAARSGRKNAAADTFVTVSFLEIYNEVFNDLLLPGGAAPPPLRLRLKNDTGDGSAGGPPIFFVDNLTRIRCETASEALNWFVLGNGRKVVRGHAVNARSSRSHCIFTLAITRRIGGDLRTMELNIVDLAGSEKIDVITQGGVADSATLLSETARINSSLLCLSKVIDALAANSGKALAARHVPYRDSKLTSVLRHALSHRCTAIIIACVNPEYFDETCRTLAFGGRARSVTVSASLLAEGSRASDAKSKLIAELRTRISQLECEVCALTDLVSSKAVAATGAAPSPYLTPPVQPCAEILDGSTRKHSDEELQAAVAAAQAAADTIIQPLTDNLMLSCDKLSSVVKVNQQLRSALDALASYQKEWSMDRMTLETENQRLRERVAVLEQALLAPRDVTSGRTVDPTPKTPRAPPPRHHPYSSTTQAGGQYKQQTGAGRPATLSLLEAAVEAADVLSHHHSAQHEPEESPRQAARSLLTRSARTVSVTRQQVQEESRNAPQSPTATARFTFHVKKISNAASLMLYRAPPSPQQQVFAAAGPPTVKRVHSRSARRDDEAITGRPPQQAGLVFNSTRSLGTLVSPRHRPESA